jgi:hypothetical protein
MNWKLDWEIDKSKPSPEQLACAGFFSYATKPFFADNVICPLSRTISIDKPWPFVGRNKSFADSITD